MEKYKDAIVWTIPGGRCDEGERLEETLRREVFEEIGITDLFIEKYLGSLPGAKEGDVIHIYHCSTSQEPFLKEPEKFSRWEWFQINVTPCNYPDINPDAFLFIKNALSK